MLTVLHSAAYALDISSEATVLKGIHNVKISVWCYGGMHSAECHIVKFCCDYLADVLLYHNVTI